jgi:hypothetical protein
MTTLTYRATAITKWRNKPPGAPAGDYRFTQVKDTDKAEVIKKAERIGGRLGDMFAVVWDLLPMEDAPLEGTPEPPVEVPPRRVRLARSREEMTWDEFLAQYGAEIGLLQEGEVV